MTKLKNLQKLLLVLASVGIARCNDDGPCESDDCWKNRAQEIENSLDVTIDPCDNFYEFSCGGWIKKNPAPHKYEFWTPENVSEHKIINKFSKILNLPDESTDSLSLKSMKHVYKNCMNTTQRDRTGFYFIEGLVTIGGWPILGSRYQLPFEVIPNIIFPVLTKVFGVEPFFRINQRKIHNNSNIFISWNRFNKNHLDNILIKFERNSTEVKKYINNIVKVAKEISIDRNIPFNTMKFLQDANDIIDFQLQLIEIEEKSSYGKTEYFQNFDEFQEWFDLHSLGINNSYALRFCYMEALFSSNENTDAKFIVINIELMKNLILLFDNTKPDTLQNFIIWDLLYKYLEFMPTKMYDIKYELDNIGKDTPGLYLDRERRCIENLPFLSAIIPKFLTLYYPDNFINSSNEIITNIIETSQEYINKTSWIFSKFETRVLDEIHDSIKYNSYLFLNDNYIDELYGYPKITPKNYMEDIFLIARLKQLRQQQSHKNFDVKIYDFLNAPIISNLNYLLSKFQPNIPLASNYGTFANIVGQSVSTFLTFIDSIFNKSTDINIIPDWSHDMKNELLRRLNDFEMQLNEYSTTYESSNETKKANILQSSIKPFLEDNFGIPAAFLAYEKNKTPKDEEISLINYPMYKDRKLFFISYASSLCTSENPEFLVKKNNLKISKKVNIALRNMKEFSDAFSCPEGSPMNPIKKIRVFGPDDEINSD